MRGFPSVQQPKAVFPQALALVQFDPSSSIFVAPLGQQPNSVLVQDFL